MPITFTKSDLEIFQVQGFQERMPLLKEKIRPKLEEFGKTLAPLFEKEFKIPVFPHTAKHMRRKVNPPDETWVALGPEKRGYKAYIYAALCIGKKGIQARIVMKDESNLRPALGTNLQKNLATLEKSLKKLDLKNYTKHDSNYNAEKISNLSDFLKENSTRLQNLKSAWFDVGLELNPASKTLDQDFLEAIRKLFPLFLCGLQAGVKLK